MTDIYIIIKDGVIPVDGYTTRKDAILKAGLPYNNSTRNSSTITRKGSEYRLYCIRAHKIKGRGKHSAFK